MKRIRDEAIVESSLVQSMEHKREEEDQPSEEVEIMEILDFHEEYLNESEVYEEVVEETIEDCEEIIVDTVWVEGAPETIVQNNDEEVTEATPPDDKSLQKSGPSDSGKPTKLTERTTKSPICGKLDASKRHRPYKCEYCAKDYLQRAQFEGKSNLMRQISDKPIYSFCRLKRTSTKNTPGRNHTNATNAVNGSTAVQHFECIKFNMPTTGVTAANSAARPTHTPITCPITGKFTYRSGCFPAPFAITVMSTGRI